MVVVQEKNINAAGSGEKIESVIATFRNFSPEKLIKNAVVYFCESHTSNSDDREKHQATIELVYKLFDMYTCEKYEIRTGYLNRYNCLPKSIDESSQEEIEEAVAKSEQVQNDWIKRCNPELPGFKLKDWRECICEEENFYFEGCKKLILSKIQKNEEFANSFSKTINEYVDKYETNEVNGAAYVLEELSWILSVPLLHLNKPIYLIHVGLVGDAIRGLFAHFPNLQKAAKWLTPKFHTIVFENECDFLMDYRSSVRVGYSYAMENKEIVKPITTFKKEFDSTKEELSQSLSREIDEKNMLYYVIDKLPGHVYWLNRDNVYLGCNDLQAKKYGLKSRHEVIGKTNKQLYPQKDADIIEKNNTRVMETGEPFVGEENSVEGVSYLTHKTPIYNAHGKITGLLGISMDITDRKRAEELEIQNEIQKKFQKVADQVVHDIRTPLQILLHVLRSCKNLSEKEHVMLRDSVDSIRNIAQEFLEYSSDKKESLEHLHILVFQILTEILDQKRRQYSDKNIDFQYSFDPSLKFIFIYGNALNFARMMSNIIDNSVEAFDEERGIIKIGFSADKENVEITIRDAGKGMPPETVEKLMKGESVSTTKQGGFGIGTTQIRDTVNEFKGKQFIESAQNVGTKITIAIPKSNNPKWFLEEITLNKGDTVVILDDDISVHGLFKKVFEPYCGDISLKFFENGQETVGFIKSFEEKNRLILLTDYELRKQRLDGFSVIEESALDNAKVIIVPGIYNRKEIQEKVESLGIKMLPKSLIEDIEIVLI
jgi:PAS domain S-box-containing protein